LAEGPEAEVRCGSIEGSRFKVQGSITEAYKPTSWHAVKRLTTLHIFKTFFVRFVIFVVKLKLMRH
jgi:hypothetical protein